MVDTIYLGKHPNVLMVSPTINSNIIFIDSTLEPSINKDNISSFDSTNNPGTSQFC